MTYFQVLESWVDIFVKQRVDKMKTPNAEKFFEQREIVFEDKRGQFLRSNIDSIHNDTAALLTHISAMIASLGIILIVFDDEIWTQSIIFMEIMSYTILAIVCVYSLKHKGGTVPMKEGFDSVEGYYDRYLWRRYVYIFCSNGVIITTVIFLVTILFHLVALAF